MFLVFLYGSVCTGSGFPGSWTGLTTESTFPIAHNTVLDVSCQEGYKNDGSDVITCNTFLYDDYSYATKPHCSRSLQGNTEKLICFTLVALFSGRGIRVSGPTTISKANLLKFPRLNHPISRLNNFDIIQHKLIGQWLSAMWISTTI